MASNGIREDVGSFVLMEHVNVTIPDQLIASTFYIGGLGLTRDPYLMVGLDNMWINAGEQQFHLPTRAPQVLRGHIGLVVPSLDELRDRLGTVKERLAGSRFDYADGESCVEVVCPWGNRFRCYEPSARFGPIRLGIPYVQLDVPPGATGSIARFYERVMGVTVDEEDGEARVQVGRRQHLVFRGTGDPIPAYDGHHIAVYAARFTEPYAFLKERGLVTEEITNHQFRFKDIVDPDSGECVFEIEHEVRSLQHAMYLRPLINRNPTQTQRTYVRGQDALIPVS